MPQPLAPAKKTTLLGSAAAGVHSTDQTDPTIDITLADSGDVISLNADSVDALASVATYIGTDDMGDAANPATTKIVLGSAISDYSITSIDNGVYGEYVLAASRTSGDAFTIQYERGGNEIYAVVRTLNGVEVATASAAGSWETRYPATQPANITSLLAIVTLGASTSQACDPPYSTARRDCIDLCGSKKVGAFEYSCDPNTGAVSVRCNCKSSD